MRARWKLLGGAGLFGVSLVFLIGHSRISHGDPAQTSAPAAMPLPAHDPTTPYDLPGATPYDHLTAADRADVDAIQQTIGLGQPDTSYGAFAAGAAAAAADAQAQIAARAVGLVDTAQDGVVP